MSAIVQGIPLWVAPLLFVLVALGLRATRPRTTSPLVLYALPLLGLMGVNRAASLPHGDLALGLLLAGCLAGSLVGYARQARWIVGRDARLVMLRGEWMTMATMLSLFAVNFAAGMTQGAAPGVAASTGFAAAYGLVAGGLSGLFLGRAVRVAFWPVQAAG